MRWGWGGRGWGGRAGYEMLGVGVGDFQLCLQERVESGLETVQ